MKPEKRITKHRMKEDKLVTTIFVAYEYLQKNYQRLLLILGSAVLVLLAAIFLIRGQKSKAQRAEASLGLAQLRVDAGDLQGGILDLRKVIEQYGGSAAGRKALYFLGNAYLTNKDFSQASQFYKRFIEKGIKEPLLLASAHAGLAICYEHENKFAQAGAEYLKAAGVAQKSFLTPEYLANAVRAYLKGNQPQQAEQIHQQLIADYPRDFNNLAQARMYLAQYHRFDYGQ